MKTTHTLMTAVLASAIWVPLQGLYSQDPCLGGAGATPCRQAQIFSLAYWGGTALRREYFNIASRPLPDQNPKRPPEAPANPVAALNLIGKLIAIGSPVAPTITVSPVGGDLPLKVTIKIQRTVDGHVAVPLVHATYKVDVAKAAAKIDEYNKALDSYQKARILRVEVPACNR